MSPVIGRRPGSRILVFYSRNLSHTLTKRMVLSGILVEIISKYRKEILFSQAVLKLKLAIIQKLISSETFWNSENFPKVTQISLLVKTQAGLIDCIS